MISAFLNLVVAIEIFYGPILLLGAIYEVLLLFVFFLNYKNKLSFVRAYFATISILFLTSLSLLVGKEMDFQLYLLTVALLTYFIGPPKEKRTTLTLVAIAFLVFIAIEYWFIDHDSFHKFAAPKEVMAFTKMVMHVGLGILVTGFSYYIYNTYMSAEIELDQERAKSEGLLLNILPKSIAERLKGKETFIADRFDQAAILFADIVGFTELAESMSPEQVVNLLNDIFSEFDRESEKFGLEKIKTIGDAYMVAGGIPSEDEESLKKIAHLALSMQTIMRNKYGDRIRLRIGMHTGPAVAGIIGQRKFTYDLWGDSVNTASRMESHGLGGSINVSKDVYEKLNDSFDFEFRGKISMKGKGELETYLLTGIKNS
ncbi:adenylate/guanylate cyclase domain-containing protein [Leptospira perolatii]|nr:adenylate/guanylate cyclase domain-containing protein [Leptospira perolatii]